MVDRDELPHRHTGPGTDVAHQPGTQEPERVSKVSPTYRSHSVKHEPGRHSAVLTMCHNARRSGGSDGIQRYKVARPAPSLSPLLERNPLCPRWDSNPRPMD